MNCNAKKNEPNDETKKYEIQCEFCRKKYDLTSILKHIGANEACKLYYGPRYEEWKKNHKRLKMSFYRHIEGTEKELDQQRKRYASNPDVREKKRKQYEEDKKNQLILQEEQEKQWRKNDAKRSVDYFEERYRQSNQQSYKCFRWFTDFFETFS